MPGARGRAAGGSSRRRQTESSASPRRPARTLATGARPVTAIATRTCTHRNGWTHTGGEATCGSCGVRRFTDYRAVRPPGLAQAVTAPRKATAITDCAAAEWVMLRTRRKRWWPGR
ncbi:DUF6255 family natural product biosynthesis protein [Streptomyces olivoreticuli]